MRVVATHNFLRNDMDFIKQSLTNVEFIFPDEFSDEFLLEQCDIGVDVFLGPPPSKEVLIKALPRLKLVQIPWSGVESISFEDTRLLNIPCANSHSSSIVVAEMAISLLFELLKKIALHDRDLRSGIWHRPGDKTGFFPASKLSGSRVGFFGYGAINKTIHKMLSGFDITFSICVNTLRDIDNISKVYDSNDLCSFLGEIDILFVGAPLTRDTDSIFNKKTLSNLKSTAFIINISRANIFEESDLFEFLKARLISGAALDVWWQNPPRGVSSGMPSMHPFNQLSNVVMSPHRSGYSLGELPHLDGAIENIDRISKKQTAKFLINFTRGY